MLLKLTMLKLSEKVRAYIEEVEKETGYNVSIENFQGGDARVTLDHKHKYIHVEINEEGYKEDSEEEIDFTIAHEVTHEFLSLKKKYCRLSCGDEMRDTVERIETRLASMIEDIVVNKIIQKKNYRPYSTQCLDDVKWETKLARKGLDCYKSYNNDPTYKDMYMVSRYIQAWGILRYFNPGEINKKTIHKFLKIFQKSYPKQYEEAEKIKEIILENDIFTREGYCKTIKECLDLWNFTHLVGIYTCQRYDIIITNNTNITSI